MTLTIDFQSLMLNSYKQSWMVSTRGTPAQGTPHHEVFGAKQRGHPSLEFTLTGFCIELWLYVKLAFLRYQVYQYLDSNVISILMLILSTDNKKILLTTRNVMLNSLCNKIKMTNSSKKGLVWWIFETYQFQ